MDQSHGTIASFVTAPEVLATSEPIESPSASLKYEREELVKAGAIAAACDSKDVQTLAILAAREGGFLTEHLRRRACEFTLALPISIGLNVCAAIY